MANRHLLLCGSAGGTSLPREWRHRPPVRLQLGRGHRDIHLRIDHLSKQTCANLPAIAVDLLEIAAYVYTADQLIRRGGQKEFEYGKRWHRHFRFEIPVRRTEIWKRAEVTTALEDVLGFLSADDYEFDFVPHPDPPSIDRYLFEQLQAQEAAPFQEVVLFSGGLDSLGGAIQAILHGHRRVLLVSHRPVNKVYARQCELASKLAELVPDGRLKPWHVALEVNKGKSLGRDFNQRTRSFLFAALAAVVAQTFNLSHIRFYENGITSLHLPISPQLLDGRASRTTHPTVLQGFQQVFSLLFDCSFVVDNPYIWKTKAEVLKEIKTAGYGRLCALTSSCTHTLTQTTMYTHCGRCSQCVDRRLSVLAAGFDELEDPPDKYESDVLTGPREGKEYILIERYLGSALQVQKIQTVNEFVTQFGEVSRVLRHLNAAPELVAEKIFKLYSRYANQVCTALAKEVERESREIVLQKYPSNCLLSMACGRTTKAAGKVSTDAVRHEVAKDQLKPLVLDRDTFEARRRDGRSCFLGNHKEFRLLERLNERPGNYFSVDTLREDVWEGLHVEKNTVQRTVSNLRQRVRGLGIGIDGSQPDHYRLVIDP
jgi:7-cyano-7-deazaguanine synthase in queuosine biosynthesis